MVDRFGNAAAHTTTAEPVMSHFICHIGYAPKVGFSEIPPVSNVMPFPTSTTGGSLGGPPRYSTTTIRGGAAEPLPTASSASIPRFASSFSS